MSEEPEASAEKFVEMRTTIYALRGEIVSISAGLEMHLASQIGWIFEIVPVDPRFERFRNSVCSRLGATQKLAVIREAMEEAELDSESRQLARICSWIFEQRNQIAHATVDVDMQSPEMIWREDDPKYALPQIMAALHSYSLSRSGKGLVYQSVEVERLERIRDLANSAASLAGLFMVGLFPRKDVSLAASVKENVRLNPGSYKEFMAWRPPA